MNTLLPADAPAAYRRAQLGARTLKWMTERGWIDHRKFERACKAYDDTARLIARVTVRETV